MSNAHRYNSLGQILAAGGEIGIALQIAAGKDRNQVAVIIASRFPGLSLADTKRLYDFASQMAEAGQHSDWSSGEEIIDVESWPVNPYLFGNDPLGRRALIAGTYTSPATGKVIDIRAEIAGTETLDEVIEGLLEKLAKFITMSPAFANRIGFDTGSASDFIFSITERRY